MKYIDFKLFNSKATALAICGILSIFGMVGTASAECVVDDENDPSNFTLLIDATSSCSNLNNMVGCEVGSSGSCTIVNPNDPNNPDESIQVTLTGGSVGGTDPINWSSTSTNGKQVDFAIVVGATGGGTCGTSYTPGSDNGSGLGFVKNNGSNQKVNAVSFCSDFTEPAPAEPLLVVTKTVVLTPESGNADCSLSTGTLDIAVGDEVTYCYEVKNVGAGEAQYVTLVDDKGTPVDSDDDVDVDLREAFYGDLISSPVQLASGATAYGTLPVTILKAGTVVNTATAKLGGTFEASDTATVNAVLVAESCPPELQLDINDLADSTGLDYAFLLDPNNGGRTSVCTPDGKTGNAPAAVRIQCIDQCVTKTDCQDNPNAPGCEYSVCEESGAWTTDAGTADCAEATNPPQGVLPYCWEVQQDLKQECPLEPAKWESQEETVLNVKKGHVNPYIYESCYSSGGRFVCETICFPYFSGDCD